MRFFKPPVNQGPPPEDPSKVAARKAAASAVAASFAQGAARVWAPGGWPLHGQVAETSRDAARDAATARAALQPDPHERRHFEAMASG